MKIVEIDGKLLKIVNNENHKTCEGCYFVGKPCYHIRYSCDNSIFVELDKYEELFYKKDGDEKNVDM